MVTVAFSNGARLNLVLEVGGESIHPPRALLDSGFTHKAFGLLLPKSCLPSDQPTGTATIELADGTSRPVELLPKVAITRIEDQWLDQVIETPAAFWEGDQPLVGTKLMKLWEVHFNGPGSWVRIDLEP